MECIMSANQLFPLERLANKARTVYALVLQQKPWKNLYYKILGAEEKTCDNASS